jgi:hypothetical protein
MCVECGFVQAVCDARKRFIFVAMDMPGSTHDSRAFGFSALWAALDAGLVAEGFYLLGDAAYRGLFTATGNKSPMGGTYTSKKIGSDTKGPTACVFKSLKCRGTLPFVRFCLTNSCVCVCVCVCVSA